MTEAFWETVRTPWHAFALRCPLCHRIAAHWVVDSDEDTTPAAIAEHGRWHSTNKPTNEGGVRNPCPCVWDAYPEPRPGDPVKASRRGPHAGVVAGTVTLRVAVKDAARYVRIGYVI